MLTVAILAGGLAKRLRPITETVPKSLLEINGEPFAMHQLRLLQAKGIAIKNALPKLGESFFVIYGDSYLPCDYAAIARNFESAGVLGMMTVFRNEGKWDTSNVEFEAGKILAYSKTNRSPRMRYIDYGLGVFRAEAFEGLPAGKPYDLAGLYTDLLQRGQLAAFEVRERFYEIGSPAGLRETSEFLAAPRVNQT